MTPEMGLDESLRVQQAEDEQRKALAETSEKTARDRELGVAVEQMTRHSRSLVVQQKLPYVASLLENIDADISEMFRIIIRRQDAARMYRDHYAKQLAEEKAAELRDAENHRRLQLDSAWRAIGATARRTLAAALATTDTSVRSHLIETAAAHVRAGVIDSGWTGDPPDNLEQLRDKVLELATVARGERR